MARLRILPLPGNDSPFAVVLDRVSAEDALALGLYQEPGCSPAATIAEQLGARTALIYEGDLELPSDESEGDEEILRLIRERDELHAEIGLTHGQLHSAALSAIRGKHANIRELIERAERAEAERAEARAWARHGYEIGQKHCGWTDHGVAPEWLTEDWPPSFDSCEHLKTSADFDTRLTKVRTLHAAVAYCGRRICTECSGFDSSTDNAPVEWPCDTVKAATGPDAT